LIPISIIAHALGKKEDKIEKEKNQ